MLKSWETSEKSTIFKEKNMKINANQPEKLKKITDWLISQEGYITTSQKNILKKYGVGEVELMIEEPQEGKLDFEVLEKDNRVVFVIRANKFIEREFKKFYLNADEVKEVLKNQREKYLSHLAEVGFKDHFNYEAERLFGDDEQLKAIALKMASGKIDIDDYCDGRSKQVETALTGGKRFDELEQSGFANYQEFCTYLSNLRDKKERLIGLQRAIERNLETLKRRNGAYDWLKNEELKKATKQILQKAKETKDEIVNRLTQEYLNSLPKGIQAELKRNEWCVKRDIEEKLEDWEREIIIEANEKIAEAKKSWTAEQWKQYFPQDEPYDRGQASCLLSMRINRYSSDEKNGFYHEIVKQRKTSFEPKYDACYHCIESLDAMGKPSFELLLATKHRLIYTCSRCENTEIFFDIWEWVK